MHAVSMYQSPGAESGLRMGFTWRYLPLAAAIAASYAGVPGAGIVQK
jgi:hypothetical protein